MNACLVHGALLIWLAAGMGLAVGLAAVMRWR